MYEQYNKHLKSVTLQDIPEMVILSSLAVTRCPHCDTREICPKEAPVIMSNITIVTKHVCPHCGTPYVALFERSYAIDRTLLREPITCIKQVDIEELLNYCGEKIVIDEFGDVGIADILTGEVKERYMKDKFMASLFNILYPRRQKARYRAIWSSVIQSEEYMKNTDKGYYKSTGKKMFDEIFKTEHTQSLHAFFRFASTNYKTKKSATEKALMEIGQSDIYASFAITLDSLIKSDIIKV